MIKTPATALSLSPDGEEPGDDLHSILCVLHSLALLIWRVQRIP